MPESTARFPSNRMTDSEAIVFLGEAIISLSLAIVILTERIEQIEGRD